MSTKSRWFYGMCSCDWVGPNRAVDSDAQADLEKHYKETGHSDDTTPTQKMDDLMPHERKL